VSEVGDHADPPGQAEEAVDEEAPQPELVVQGRDPHATARAELLPILVFFFLAPLAVGLLVLGHAVLKGLPWYDTELAVIGWLGGCAVLLVLVERYRRQGLALQGRAELFEDRVEVYKSSGNTRFSWHDVTGYAANEVAGYVVLEVKGRLSWIGHALPTKDEPTRVALLDWLDKRGLERKG
jgi:hypothetical protein